MIIHLFYIIIWQPKVFLNSLHIQLLLKKNSKKSNMFALLSSFHEYYREQNIRASLFTRRFLSVNDIRVEYITTFYLGLLLTYINKLYHWFY